MGELNRSSLSLTAEGTPRTVELFSIPPIQNLNDSISFLYKVSGVFKTELGFFSTLNRSNSNLGDYQFAKRLAGDDSGIQFYYKGGINSTLTVYLKIPAWKTFYVPLMFNDLNIQLVFQDANIDVSELTNIPVE